MTNPAAPPGDEVLQAIAKLRETLERAGDEIDRRRRLPDEVTTALVEAGLFKLLLPTEYGGRALALPEFAAAVQELAAIDASAAWCVYQCGISNYAVAALADSRIVAELCGDPRLVVAWGPGNGTAVRTEGGYRVSGRWRFASGIHNANWIGARAELRDEQEQPILGEDGLPVVRVFLVRPEQTRIDDAWDVSGLRGTGSDGFTVDDVVIGEEYLIDYTAYTVFEEPAALRLTTSMLYGIGASSVACGIARGSLMAFLDLSWSKSTRTGVPLPDNKVVQRDVGAAWSSLEAASALLENRIAAAAAAAEARAELRHPRARLRAAISHAIETSAQFVDVVYHAAGANAIMPRTGFERRFRDVHAVTQQAQGGAAHYEKLGEYVLKPDLPIEVF
jgi:alkylation response protein AidB-like acyl-CoA dehydrogenase